MAWYKNLDGVALETYRRLVGEMRVKASKEMGISAEDLVLRDFTVDDLQPGGASTSAYWNFGVQTNAFGFISGGAGATDLSGVVIDDNRFVGIYGVMNAASGTISLIGLPDPGATIATSGFGSYIKEFTVPVVGLIRVTRKGSTARYWNVQPLYWWQDKTGYTDEPVVFDQNTTVTLEVTGLSDASSARNFMLIGAVVEKKGLVVNP